MSQPCDNCAHLQAQVSRLEAENLRLRKKVRSLETEIDRLLRLIYSVAQYCYGVAQQTASQMKNVSKAEWAFYKGQYEVAMAVFNSLRGE